MQCLGAKRTKSSSWVRKDLPPNLPLKSVNARPDEFLLVYEMNGKPLTRDHGYPIRMAEIGKYGYKWCKWLTKITLHGDDYKGHYEAYRGWSDTAVRGEPIV